MGAGPGLSASFARLLAGGGHKVALAARDTEKLQALAAETGAALHACDAPTRRRSPPCSPPSAPPASCSTTPATAPAARLSSSTRPRCSARCEVTAFGAFLVAQQAARAMLAAGGGCIMLTGASAGVKGFPHSAPFAMGKFALRGLAQSMARELHPQGIHVVHVVVDGAIRAPRRSEASPDSTWTRTPSRDHGRHAGPAPLLLDGRDRGAPLGRTVLSPPDAAGRPADPVPGAGPRHPAGATSRRWPTPSAGTASALRPHMKTAKSIDVARLALAGQPGGITVSTLAEAEYFVGHGLFDIMYAVGITPQKLAEIGKLNAAGADIAVITDDVAMAAAVAASPVRVRGLVEVDTGEGRGGLRPDAPELHQVAAALGASMAGVTHPCRAQLPGPQRGAARRRGGRGARRHRGGGQPAAPRRVRRRRSCRSAARPPRCTRPGWTA